MAQSCDQGERRLPIIIAAAFMRGGTQPKLRYEPHQPYKQVGRLPSSTTTGPMPRAAAAAAPPPPQPTFTTLTQAKPNYGSSLVSNVISICQMHEYQ